MIALGSSKSPKSIYLEVTDCKKAKKEKKNNQNQKTPKPTKQTNKQKQTKKASNYTKMRTLGKNTEKGQLKNKCLQLTRRLFISSISKAQKDGRTSTTQTSDISHSTLSPKQSIDRI